jgi:large subunit ribosomal protein L15
MPLVRRIRKYGFKRPQRVESRIVNVGALTVFGAGATVEITSLVERGLIRGGDAPVKLLALGEAPSDLTIRVHGASASARQKIEAAGGKVEIVE